jgi:F-type H+-transporting ATPase subunit b|tara:strand:- start:8 stop:493 length:486 start_codon:yes stop_codon:yes gene_type:complete
MFSDPQFWVAIAFIVFIAAIFNPVRKILSSSLDKKIDEIRNSIDEAENLKNETQVILADIKKRQNQVGSEIEIINSNVKTQIKSLESQSQQKLAEQSTKHELLAKEKIEQITREANLKIQQNIIQTSIDATINLIEKKLNKEEKINLINQSIKDFSNTINN